MFGALANQDILAQAGNCKCKILYSADMMAVLLSFWLVGESG